MGVDTKLHLPPESRVKDVFDILILLLGGKATKQGFRNHDGWSTKVTPEPHFSVLSAIPTMTTVDGEVEGSFYHVFYHFEGGGIISGWKQMTTGYRERRRPVFEGLADFFGGMLDMADSDDTEVDYIGHASRLPYRGWTTGWPDDSVSHKLEASQIYEKMLENSPPFPVVWLFGTTSNIFSMSTDVLVRDKDEDKFDAYLLTLGSDAEKFTDAFR